MVILRPTRNRARTGFTLLELMIVVAVIGILAAASMPNFQRWQRDLRAKAAARSMADVVQRARQEAIRTRQNHLVFFWVDPQGNALFDASGQRLAAILVNDANGNGLEDAGERVAEVKADATGTLAWGVSLAAVPAPNDTDPLAQCCGAGFGGFTFVDPANNPSSWIAFFPDGVPRAFSTGPFVAGPVGAGGGGVYLTNTTRDYALVVTPLGGTRVHVFDPTLGGGQWRN